VRAVNLIPVEQRGGASVGAGRSGGAAYAVMVVLGGFALFAYLYGRANHEISSRQAETTEITARAQHAQLETSRLAPYTSFIALREQRMNAVSELADTRFDWAHAFHEFGRVLPREISVTSLTGTIAGAGPAAGGAAAASAVPSAARAAAAGSSSTVTSATPPGSVPTFTLAGCATSQPAVALLLDRLRLMDGVSDVTLQSSTKGGSSGGGGGCTAGQPAYTVQISFDPLPTPAATRATTANVSNVARPSTGTASKSIGGVR
jgi:hypothetical protein